MASSRGRLIDDEPAVVKAAEEPLHLEAMPGRSKKSSEPAEGPAGSSIKGAPSEGCRGEGGHVPS